MSNSSSADDPRVRAVDASLEDLPPGLEGSESSPNAAPDAAQAALQRELASAQDRNLRLAAELENVRARSARELAEQQKYAALPLLRDLLPVLDNVDRAIEAAQKDAASGGLLEGFRLVRQQLAAALQRHQCEPIEAAGAPFDPQCHEALAQYPSEECPSQHVMQVVQQGYRLHDRVVRAAQVIVSTGSAAGSATNAACSSNSSKSSSD